MIEKYKIMIMRRKLISLLKLLLAAIVLQIGIYYYLDQVVLVPAANFSQHIISDGNNESIDPDKMSTDHNYYANISDTAVTFLTADNQTVKDIPLQDKDIVSYFTWVPNTHLALFGLSSDTAYNTTVTLRAVNLDTDSYPVEPKISGLAKGYKIDYVAAAPQVNVTYIMVSNQTYSLIYRTDANNQLTRVLTASTGTRIACLQSVDMLLYDNKNSGIIYARSSNGKRKSISPKTGKYSLIGADIDDNIFIGQLDKTGKITSVLKGSINGDFTECETMISPCLPQNMTVTYDGRLQVSYS